MRGRVTWGAGTLVLFHFAQPSATNISGTGRRRGIFQLMFNPMPIQHLQRRDANHHGQSFRNTNENVFLHLQMFTRRFKSRKGKCVFLVKHLNGFLSKKVCCLSWNFQISLFRALWRVQHVEKYIWNTLDEYKYWPFILHQTLISFQMIHCWFQSSVWDWKFQCCFIINRGCKQQQIVI